MDITWHGHSCFRIAERGKATFVTDPYDTSIGYPPLNLKADVVTISHDAPGHASLKGVRDYRVVIDRAGEFDVGGVFVLGTPMFNRKENCPRYNLAYTLDYGHLTVLHLGDLAHVPPQSDLDALGQVNVALVPVGEGLALSPAQAAEVIAMLEPNYVIPMHYQTSYSALNLAPVERFLTEMGVTSPEEVETLKVTTGALPEQTQVVLLSYRG
jgi:L-ascorbate metabolism protein UlaG (beta-lactamase superfamily)